MQVTLGEEGSGFSKLPLFLAVVGNIAGDAPPLMLPLFLSLRLSEVEREFGGSRATPARPGLKMDLDEIFMVLSSESNVVVGGVVKRITLVVFRWPWLWGLVALVEGW